MKNSRDISVATQALINALGTGLPVTAPLIDNTAVGSFWARVGVTISPSPTTIANNLTRIPSVIQIVDINANAVVYRTNTDKAAATPLSLVLRASATCVVSLLVA